MRTIQTTATIDPDGTLTARVPPDVPTGEHEVVVVIAAQQAAREGTEQLELPVIHVGEWPEGLSLRREDMYGDWGR